MIALLIVLVVIPVGLFARSQRAGADAASFTGFLANYTGDALWPILFYFIGRCLLPCAKTSTLAAGTLALTLVIEFSQLWQPPLLQWLREQPVIAFLLGNSFIWSDVACLVVGTGMAVILDSVAAKLWGGRAKPMGSATDRSLV